MKRLDRYVLRLESIVTGKKNLEHLYSFKDFPVFMGCVDSPADDDLFADMDWAIDPETGIIQLEKLLPLEALYMNQHCDGTGKIWQDHYTAFTKFLHKFSPKNVLEIGGAHDHIARNYRALDAHISWTIIEPNPEHIEDTRTKVIKAWFDNTFAIEGHFDTVIHSHVVEHAYNPLLFIEHISKFMGKSDRHIFSFPLLLPMFKLKWTNCLNFEHTVFLTEEIIEYILKKFGFIVLEKEYYGNPHSVFYATEKADVPVFIPPMDNKYVEYRKIFMDFIDFHKEMAADLNRKIESASEPVYLFGAHIFSEFLIQFGLRTEKIVSVLDNSRFKIGRRLYGTNFFVESPAVLKNKGPANVILKAGGYNEEIKKDILENINHEVKFW